MDNVEIMSFLKFKKGKLGVEFPIKLSVLQNYGEWLPFQINMMITESGMDYKLTFMDDIVRTYIGGYVQMNVSYLKDVKYTNGVLSFETSNGKKVKLS